VQSFAVTSTKTETPINMSTNTAEYLPQDSEARPRQKAFDLVPHKDDGYQIVLARRAARRDRNLADGAFRLFDEILDLALNANTWEHRGCVAVSMTRLAHLLGCGRRSIIDWNEQLVAGNHVWITSKQIPNFWDMNLYHIRALEAGGETSQSVRGIGMYGNGVRRGLAGQSRGNANERSGHPGGRDLHPAARAKNAAAGPDRGTQKGREAMKTPGLLMMRALLEDPDEHLVVPKAKTASSVAERMRRYRARKILYRQLLRAKSLGLPISDAIALLHAAWQTDPPKKCPPRFSP
jgi:hypothetical protein